MNRNVESHFAELPSADIQRSIFDRSSGHKTSFNVGDLIPFYVDEVLPGDTFQISTSVVCRLQTLLTPIMDNMYLDTYYFFVPYRLVWNHWKNFMGENTQSAWTPTTEYSIPVITYPNGGFNIGTIADYLGVPTGVRSMSTDDCPSALPFRAYALICQEWFRDQNLTDPLSIEFGDNNVAGVNTGNYITDVAKGGLPFKVAKYHDYFTSSLPQPAKIPPSSNGVNALGLSSNPKDTMARVYTGPDHNAYPLATIPDFGNMNVGMTFTHPSDIATGGTYTLKGSAETASTGYASESNNWLKANSAPAGSAYGIIPDNLWADLNPILGQVTVNTLRLAFQLQKFYEKNARGGTRYREMILSHFGVHSPDARMMIPEYLGGHRVPLSIHQVANQSQGESDFLGDLGAMSNTSDVHEDFVKSFTEHGVCIGLACVRYDHSYPQGIEKMWLRRNLTDFYFPVFANIGEQPIKSRELYLDNYYSGDNNNANVFGYQEAWAEYRYKPSRVSGEMRPGIANSLANWHLADYYTTRPTLSDSWIREDKSNVDRVLAVTSLVSNQVFADFYIQNICTRPMPMYSIPGLIDHH